MGEAVGELEGRTDDCGGVEGEWRMRMKDKKTRSGSRSEGKVFKASGMEECLGASN